MNIIIKKKTCSMFSNRIIVWPKLKPRLVILITLLALITMCLVDRASNESATRTTMCVVKRRILLFAHQNNRIPKSLAELPTLTGFDNSTKDAWGRPIQYEVNGNKTVTLKSFGRDGLPGGVNDNQDIILSFPTHCIEGGWSDPLVEWLKD